MGHDNPLDLYKEPPVNPNASVMIAIPCTHNKMHTMTAVSLIAMPKPTFGIVVVNNKPVDVARNKCVKRFLDAPNATHLFFADSDMWYPQNTLFQLLRDNLPVVAGLTYQRDKPFAPVILNRREYRKGGNTLQWIPWEDGMNDKIIQCDATGGACLLIRRDVLELMEPPWFRTVVADDGADIITGEDIYFFDKLKAMDIPCHIDTRIITHHAADETIVIPRYFQEGWLTLGDRSMKALDNIKAGWALSNLQEVRE